MRNNARHLASALLATVLGLSALYYLQLILVAKLLGGDTSLNLVPRFDSHRDPDVVASQLIAPTALLTLALVVHLWSWARWSSVALHRGLLVGALSVALLSQLGGYLDLWPESPSSRVPGALALTGVTVLLLSFWPAIADRQGSAGGGEARRVDRASRHG